ncbi:MAG: hypothetical protein GWP91_10720, partial [Rhodobacterales bacterium]|nr:hypothetical protein [Rhodobacterales bacterium]
LRVAKECEDLGSIESHPRMDGRQMFMILQPFNKPAVRPARVRKTKKPSPGVQLPVDETSEVEAAQTSAEEVDETSEVEVDETSEPVPEATPEG